MQAFWWPLHKVFLYTSHFGATSTASITNIAQRFHYFLFSYTFLLWMSNMLDINISFRTNKLLSLLKLYCARLTKVRDPCSIACRLSLVHCERSLHLFRLHWRMPLSIVVDNKSSTQWIWTYLVKEYYPCSFFFCKKCQATLDYLYLNVFPYPK